MDAVEGQITDSLFTVSLCIVDNDSGESARTVVAEVSRRSRIPIEYLCEAEQNIARARNKAVENARGDFVAFIDDDEIPDDQWLVRLYRTFRQTGADGVLGPVVPSFESPPPQWIVRGRIFERPTNTTGKVLGWEETRTGNVLFRRTVFEDSTHRFDLAYGRGGEDRDFFRRMISSGLTFVWCNEAAVHELIPASRCTRSFHVRRALLRGKAASPVPFANGRAAAKSLFALLAYLSLLPFFVVWSESLCMKYLISACDHLGRVLGFFGLNVIKTKYIS
jgi:succinoglycan biosynthesis protein ExoM